MKIINTKIALLIGAIIILLGSIILCTYKLYRNYPRFYTQEGLEIPYHAIDSLVKSGYTTLSPRGNALVWTYFDKPVIDLPEEYKLIKPTDTLKGHWENQVLIIEFNNSNNR